MIFAIVTSSAIFIIGILAFTTNIGKMLPSGVKLLPFISIVVLWIQTYFFVLPQKGGILDVVLLVIFYFIAILVVLPIGAGILVFAILDREKVIQPEMIGDPSRKEKVCIVYHPGMSDFTITNIRTVALKLAEKGFSTTIASVHKRLAVLLKNYKAIVFASPIYAGAIRPPLARFIERNDLSSIRCYLLITGGVRASAQAELMNATKIIAGSHGNVAGAIKAVIDENDSELKRKLEGFAADIASGK